MPGAEHYTKLENLYLSAPCNTHYDPAISISEGRAEVSIPIKPHLYHAAGATHGCAYFKVLDDASFFAANSLVEDVFVLTTQFNVHFTRPVESGRITATGRVVHGSKNLIVAEATVTDAEGREIGRGSGSFMRSRITLESCPGYTLEPMESP